jgi:hypothetical protein
MPKLLELPVSSARFQIMMVNWLMVTSRLLGSVYPVSSLKGNDGCTTCCLFYSCFHSEKVPELFFHVVDRGDLDGSTPVAANQMAITVAPEVVHLSRFAKRYKLHPDNELRSRFEVCLHNGGVAESLQQVRTIGGSVFAFKVVNSVDNKREI